VKVLPACALSIYFLCADAAGGAQVFKFDAQIGVVDTNRQKELCLSIRNAGLAEGIPVSIVLPGKPQAVVRAVVVMKLEANCSRNPIPLQ